jgi:hypothetical protein
MDEQDLQDGLIGSGALLSRKKSNSIQPGYILSILLIHVPSSSDDDV